MRLACWSCWLRYPGGVRSRDGTGPALPGASGPARDCWLGPPAPGCRLADDLPSRSVGDGELGDASAHRDRRCRCGPASRRAARRARVIRPHPRHRCHPIRTPHRLCSRSPRRSTTTTTPAITGPFTRGGMRAARRSSPGPTTSGGTRTARAVRTRCRRPKASARAARDGAWLVHYEIGGQQLTDYWFYVHRRWVFDLVLSNPDAVKLYRMSPQQYAAALGCNH